MKKQIQLAGTYDTLKYIKNQFNLLKKKKQQTYPKTSLRLGSYYKTTIDNLKIMNHLKLLTKYN